MIIRLKIEGVRSYKKDGTDANGNAVKLNRRVATLKFAEFDWDQPEKSGILQRFVDESDEDYEFYVEGNVGKNIELACPVMNEASNGAWFLTVEKARLSDKTDWIAPVSTAAVENGSTMNA